jgi:hypothetical protein
MHGLELKGQDGPPVDLRLRFILMGDVQTKIRKLDSSVMTAVSSSFAGR